MISKEDLIEGRRGFFDAVVNQLFMPPHEVDALMNQSHLYVPPEESSLVSAPEHGYLVIHVKPIFFGSETHFCYSFFQFGDFLKLHLVFYGKELESAPVADSHQEINRIWPGSISEPIWRGETMLYEWTFELSGKDFYRNYEIQERFILNMRHMHFRLLRIFHDAMEENEKLRRSSS